MVKRKIYDKEGHDVHFVTFSCYKRRRLLDHDDAKRIVIAILGSQLKNQNGKCIGFVIMPDHVHALLWFPNNNQLSNFMKQWKRLSSFRIKKLLKNNLQKYFSTFDSSDPIWQARYYGFNIFNERKLLEKLQYMHANPVKAKLAECPCDWGYSSARYYEQGSSVGVQLEWVS